MNLTELKQAIAAKANLSQAEADRLLKAVIETLTEALKKGEPVTMVGFGSFDVAERPARVGRNPSTGAEISIPASKSVRFKVGKGLKDAVNGK